MADAHYAAAAHIRVADRMNELVPVARLVLSGAAATLFLASVLLAIRILREADQ